MIQLDMFPPPPPPPVVYVPRETRKIMTKAYGTDYALSGYVGDPEPFEIEVRGIPCLINPTGGFKTYALQPFGTPFWSETGFRSFCIGDWHVKGGLIFPGTTNDMIRIIEANIDAKVSNGGFGGKLKKWWPSYVLQWRQDVSFFHGVDRSDIWDQWGPETHVKTWAAFDKRQAERMARMLSDGIDPNDVEPPFWHKGKWPRFSPSTTAQVA